MQKILLPFFILLNSLLFAQKVSLTIFAKTDKNESVEFANLLIRNEKDSTLVWSGTFKEDGQLKAALNANKNYFVNVSLLGLVPYNQLVKIEKEAKTLNIVLAATSTTLGEVTVKYREKLVRQEDDKDIVDAEPLSKISSNAFELLEKTPGVIIVDDNIYLGKAEQARIYINGREMKLGSSDLASILKSMPPNSVQRIELLRTPSAKFDASSSGGIINIVLKKGVRLGTNGVVNLSHSQGVYGRFSGGVSINHGNENTTTYLNYQYNKRNNFEDLITTRQFNDGKTSLFQTASTLFPAQTHYIAAGIDHKINEKWNISDDFIFNKDDNQSNVRNNNYIYNTTLTKKDTALTHTGIQNQIGRFNINNTLTASMKLDTNGGEWNTSFNFIHSNNSTNQYYLSLILLPIVPTDKMFINKNGDIAGSRQLFALTTDFSKKLPYKIKLETGLKLDFLTNDSKSAFILNKKSDVQNSITYTYRENINAAYLQFSRPIEKITLKTGFRIENTNMFGHQTTPSDTTFKVNRTDVFPYLYLSRKLVRLFNSFDLNGNFIARRSIRRPDYAILNPASQNVDEFFKQVGNPAIQPQFTNTYEFNIAYNDYPVLAIGTDETKNVFDKVVYQNTQTKVFTETYDNLGALRQYYFRLVGGLPPGGMYFGIVGMMYNYQIYKGLYQGESLDFKRGSWTVFTYHELKLGKTALLSANGFFRLKGVQNFYELENLGDLTLSLSKKFLAQKLQIILRANDIFYTMKTNFSLQQGGIDATGRRVGDTRRFGVTVRYNFGVQTEKKKKGESENVFDMVNPAKRTN